MKSFSLVLLISAIAVVSCNQCTYDYEPLLVWANDKQYNDAASLPFVFADYNAMQQGTGVSLADLEAKRQETVAWLQEGFGIPASQAFYDPNSHITAYPGLGNIIPIYFADAYELVSSSEPSFGLSRCYHLAAVEFVFIANADINFVYGGKFGQLIDLVGGSKQALGTDGISVGWYYIQRDSGPHTRNVKRVAYKSVLPNRNDFSWRAHQYMKMVDSEWGVGWSIMERSLYANYSNGKLISQILNSWKFNEQYDIYAAVGISV
jgi:hypothetical protein